jgi:DNA-binding beta-propeller fold protein YncE
MLNNPFDIAFTVDGDMIFSDTFNHCIRAVDTKTGIIRNVAGTGERGFGGDGGPATEARLNEPYGVVVDRSGQIFFADRLNRRVRTIDPAGRITTLAGDGSGQYSGDGGPAATAGLAEPNGLALDAAETKLYIADVADHRVRVVDLTTGTIATVAGTGDAKHDGDGGPATSAGIFGARAVAFAPDGSLYVMERQGSSIRRIRDGIIETVAGTPGERGYAGDGSDAKAAVFAAPKEMAVDTAGNIFVVDTENHAIRMIDARTWIVDTVAGPATGAGLARPHGAAVGPDGAIYIGDSETHRVRKLTRV